MIFKRIWCTNSDEKMIAVNGDYAEWRYRTDVEATLINILSLFDDG
jgi:hypothetical protein